MIAIINFGSFGGKLEVKDGKAIISSDDSGSNFGVHFEELSHLQINKASIMPGSNLKIDFEQDGQVICIEEGVYHIGKLAFRRFKRPEAVGEVLKEEYLTKKGQWAHRPPDDDILLVPISFSEEGCF